MTSPVLLKKEDIRLPDHYFVTFHPITGDKPIKYQVARHQFLNNDLRAIELTLSDRRYMVIALELGTFEFSQEFHDIVDLKKIKDEAQKEKANSQK